MKLITYLEESWPLEHLQKGGIEEVIICPSELSCLGRKGMNSLWPLVHQAHEQGFKLFLEWDIPMTEDEFQRVQEFLRKNVNDQNLSLFSGVRVQDPGALLWVQENWPLPVHFIGEKGFHNGPSWELLREQSQGRLQRAVLSHEIQAASMGEIVEGLQAKGVKEAEMLIAGKILLFHSPRSLISPLMGERELGEEGGIRHEYLADSEESAHKNFLTVENAHGTFLFHRKHLQLLDEESLLNEAGLTHGRLDLREMNPQQMGAFFGLLQRRQGIKEGYPFENFKGLFLSNRTDVLFKKLKNTLLIPKDRDYFGEIMDVEKESYVAVSYRPSSHLPWERIKSGQDLSHWEFHTPTGKIIRLPFASASMDHATLMENPCAEDFHLLLLPYFKGALVRSAVYLK